MTYHTDNLTVAAALVSLGNKISKIDLIGRKATFFFDEEVNDLAFEIQIDSKFVPPMRHHAEIRRLSALAKAMAEN